MRKLSRSDVVAWVAAVYGTRDAEQWVAEGPAAFQVTLDDGRALLVRKRTGEYWSLRTATGHYKAWCDWRLRRVLRKAIFDPDNATGVVHDRGWAFLPTRGPVRFGGTTGQAVATFVVVKRTGDVWDLAAGPQAEAAYFARTEAGFRSQLAYVAPHLGPIAQIQR